MCRRRGERWRRLPGCFCFMTIMEKEEGATPALLLVWLQEPSRKAKRPQLFFDRSSLETAPDFLKMKKKTQLFKCSFKAGD